jgi:leucine-rich repeat protein SHOC2
MKKLVFLALVSLIPQVKFAQEARVFTSIEEAQAVRADSVYHLDLSGEKLEEIPAEIYAFTNLKSLDLSKNKLTALPETFYFAHLKALNLNKNKLAQFPLALTELRTLQKLTIAKNDIEELPEEIGNLGQLTHLEIWFNPILELPPTFIQLTALKYVDMRGMTYSNNFQKRWKTAMPWTEFDFDLGCDCGP